MIYPEVYAAVADTVRDQSRVPSGTPAVRLPSGQELAVVTLSGHVAFAVDQGAIEPSPVEWAARIVACLNACEGIADPEAFMNELRQPIRLSEVKAPIGMPDMPEASMRGMLGALCARIWPDGMPS